MSDVDKLMTEILGERPNVKDMALRELVMARMKAGGEVKMGRGGLLKKAVKAIGEAVEPVLPMAERQANLERFLEGSATKQRLYHGTNKDISTFESGRPVQWLAENPELANQFVTGNRRKMGNKPSKGSVVYPVHAKVKNPLDLTDATPQKAISTVDFLKQAGVDTSPENLRRLAEWDYELTKAYGGGSHLEDPVGSRIERMQYPEPLWSLLDRHMVIKALEDQGYDSVKLTEKFGNKEPYGESQTIGVFNPANIKSATGNVGTYDVGTTDITKAKGGPVKMADGGGLEEEYNFRKLGMDPTRVRSGYKRKPISRKEIQAMMLDVPAGIGVPFAEAGAEYLRGNIEDAKTSAAIDAALTAVPGAAVLAKPAYRAVKKGVQKAAPAVREAARGALESGMESGLIQGPSYVIKPSGGQWLGRHRGDTRQIDVSNAPAPISDETMQAYVERLEEARNRAREYTEMTGFEPKQDLADRIRSLEADIPRMQQSQAIRNWVDSNLNNYVRKQMGTPDDPIRKLADEGILHMPEQEVFVANTLANEREAAGFPRSGMATTGLGRMWESLSDPAIKQIEAGKLRDFERMSDIRLRKQAQDLDIGRPGAATMQPGYLAPEDARDIRNFTSAGNKIGYETMMANNPWLAKVDPSTPIYKIASGWAGEDVARDLGFNHIVDVLRADLAAGRIRPEQLSKMSMEQAVRRTHEYDLERAAAMAKALEEEAASMSVAKTFDDGFKIVQLDKPGQFAKESDRMGHSVRGYEPSRRSEDWTEASGVEGSPTYGHGGWEAIKSGDAQVFSIRDAKNQPHVTIELGRQHVSPSQWFNSLTDEEKASAIESGRRVAIEGGFMPSGGSSQKAIDEYVASYSPQFAEFKNNAPLIITQIKGKQNRAPDENYLPYIQQFIREGNYEIAGDLRNSGLIDTAGQASWDYGFPDKYVSLRDALPANAPRYLTRAEIDRIKQTGKFEPDFKEGGAVQKYAKGGPVKGFLADAIKSVVKKLGDDAAKTKAKPIATESVVNTAVNKAAERIAKDNPKLSESEIAKKAEREALAKLKWERSQKPELEARYGSLEAAKYSDPLAKRQRNVPEAVEARIERARNFLSQPTEPWKPPRPELQAFDRSLIKEALEGFPGVEQTRFPRYLAPRSDLEYINEIYDDPRNRELIEAQIKRGLPLGGETFYASLYPLKVATLERGMAPGKFEQFVYETAPASARNSIMNEMAAGQFLRDMKARGLPLDEETVAREITLFKEKYGKGLPLMPIHREGVRKIIEGGEDMRQSVIADIPTNYKIPTYGTQKAGDFAKSVVLDVHEAAGETLGSRYHPYFTEQGGFGPSEYGPAEAKMLDIAENLGIPGGMAQAGRWFGGGELTGLKSPRGDALDLLEKQTAFTLQGMGVNPTPRNVRNYILDMVETGRGVLMPWFKGEGMPDVRVEKKKGGLVAKGALPTKRK